MQIDFCTSYLLHSGELTWNRWFALVRRLKTSKRRRKWGISGNPTLLTTDNGEIDSRRSYEREKFALKLLSYLQKTTTRRCYLGLGKWSQWKWWWNRRKEIHFQWIMNADGRWEDLFKTPNFLIFSFSLLSFEVNRDTSRLSLIYTRPCLFLFFLQSFLSTKVPFLKG